MHGLYARGAMNGTYGLKLKASIGLLTSVALSVLANTKHTPCSNRN